MSQMWSSLEDDIRDCESRMRSLLKDGIRDNEGKCVTDVVVVGGRHQGLCVSRMQSSLKDGIRDNGGVIEQ